MGVLDDCEKSLCGLNNALDIVREATERNRDRMVFKRTILENYCRGIAEVAFLVRKDLPLCGGALTSAPGSYCAYSAQATTSAIDVEVWSQWVEIAKAEVSKLKHLYRSKDEAVFINDIQEIQFTKFEVPSRIRLKRFEQCDSFFTGKMYASAADGAFHSYRVSLLSDGERDCPFHKGATGLTHEIVRENVQRCPQIMQSISSDSGETFWDGYLIFGPYSTILGIRIELQNNSIMIPEELAQTRFKLQDVVTGPF